MTKHLTVTVENLTNGGDYAGTIEYRNVRNIKRDDYSIILDCEPNAGIDAHAIILNPSIHRIIGIDCE
jgi:hypothetical protein